MALAVIVLCFGVVFSSFIS